MVGDDRGRTSRRRTVGEQRADRTPSGDPRPSDNDDQPQPAAYWWRPAVARRYLSTYLPGETPEFCRRCGTTVEEYDAHPDLWARLIGEHDAPDARCIGCFTQAAIDAGLYPRWIPEIDGRLYRE